MEDESILRGSRLATIMRRQGHLLASNQGSAATYALSAPVKRIDVFISHNWSVARRPKFLALAVHFNLVLACGVTAAVQIAVLALTAAGLLPLVKVSWSPYPRGICCKMLSVPLFLFVLCFGRELAPSAACGGPIVFLDKTCIDQVNTEVQRRGIEKLGAFLCNSDSLLIVYSEVYLKKLWTIYEVATFLAMHPIERLHIVPTFLPVVFLITLGLLQLLTVLNTVLEISAGFFYTFRVLNLVFSFFFVLVIRRWARDVADIHTMLVNFSIDDCTCLNESDRDMVYHNIAALMQEIGAVSHGASEAEALVAFNRLVRSSLPGALANSSGRYGLPYSYITAMSIAAFSPYLLDQLGPGFGHGMPLPILCSLVMYWLTVIWGAVPLVVCIWGKLATYCLHLQGCKGISFCVLIWMVGHVYVILTGGLLDFLDTWCAKSSSALIPMVLTCGTTFMITSAAYWRRIRLSPGEFAFDVHTDRGEPRPQARPPGAGVQASESGASGQAAG